MRSRFSAAWGWYGRSPSTSGSATIPRQNPAVNQAERDLIARSAPAAVRDMATSRGNACSARARYGCCAGSISSFPTAGISIITWLPTYLREGRHLEFRSAAWLGVLPLFVGGMGNPAAVFLTGPLTRWTGSVVTARRWIAYAGFAGAAGFLLLSTRMNDPTLAMIAMGIASFANDLVMPGSWASAMEVGGKYCGTVSGAMNMWGNVGGALAPLVNGYILQWTDNWNLVFYVAAAIYLLGIVCWRLLDPVTPLEM